MTFLLELAAIMIGNVKSTTLERVSRTAGTIRGAVALLVHSPLDQENAMNWGLWSPWYWR